jgi:hypothetical protein
VRSLRAAARIPVGSVSFDTVLEQRIYHLTHLRNLPEIVTERAIASSGHPVVSISSEQLRSEQNEIPVPGIPEATLADFVPFFLSPDARLWQSLRERADHPRLSREALQSDTYDFVFLVSTVRHVVDSGKTFVVADGSAAGTLTRFATARDDADRMLYRLRTEDGGSPLLDAELLVQGELALESVTLIGVANDKTRAAVREALAGSDFTPKISVYPPWFAGTD